MFSNVANARIGKPETFFSLSLTIIESFKTYIKNVVHNGLFKTHQKRVFLPCSKKNFGKGMLAGVQMRYFGDYQIFVKTFEGFLNNFRVLSEISRDFRKCILSINMSFLSHKQNGLITQDAFKNSNYDTTLILFLTLILILSLTLILTQFQFNTLFLPYSLP
jgi:hypothetical protein